MLQAHEAGAAELALSSREGDGVMQHVIDRTFIADGARWIIDYKTTSLAARNEAAYQAKAEAYRPQLERFAGLFTADPRPIRCAVYFVAHDCLVELAEG